MCDKDCSAEARLRNIETQLDSVSRVVFWMGLFMVTKAVIAVFTKD
jgi:hypothetical protein